MEFFCEINFSVYKNLHIEPFNYSIKSVRFDFHSAKVSSLVIKTGRREGSLLPYFMDVHAYFYWFGCHYPLTTYLSRKELY